MSTELQLSRSAALATRELPKASFPRSSTVHSDIGKDIKLAANVKAEKLFLGQLRADSAHPILSEEVGEDAAFIPAIHLWVVVPL